LNIVFDLGGVVLHWNPEKLIATIFEDARDQRLAKSEILHHPDWVALDRGTISEDEAVKRGAGRTGLPQSKIARFMQKVPPSLVPVDDSLQLIHSLRQNGNKLYILSNMHFASIEYLEKNYTFWDLFDGKVISCRIKMVKPEKNIYDHLLTTFKLKVSETVFIDDTAINLETASQMGITPILFKDPVQCQTELKKLGCL